MRLALIGVFVLALIGAAAGFQPARTPTVAQPDREAQEDRAIERRFADRLRELTPMKPELYLLLAEDVADDSASDPAAKRLATRLYVLTYETDRRAASRPALSASACLGLVSVTGSKRDKKWLQALARVLDPRQVPAGWVEVPETPTSDSGAYRLAVLLGEVRAGDGIAARRLIDDPTVSALMDRYDSLLRQSGVPYGAAGLKKEASRWPCPECGNTRTVRRVVQGQVELRMCPVCLGVPGPHPTEEQLRGQLRFEAWLLQGNQRSWAAQLGVDLGAPLVDPDPAQLAGVFGVDPWLLIWRNGQWVEDPAMPRPVPKPPKVAPETNPASTPEGNPPPSNPAAPAAPPSGA